MRIKTAAVVAAGATFGLLGLGAGSPAGAVDSPVSVTPFAGFASSLTRAPYVTDLTQTSADVTWATDATASAPGVLQWGPSSGSCATHSTTAPSSLPTLVPASGSPGSATGRQFTVNSASEYQSTVVLTGLSPNTTYCYRPRAGSVDLLGSNASQHFTTLAAAGSSSPVTFDVVGDLGETNYSSGVDFPNYLNTDQAAIDSLIGSSGAQFVVTAGDVAYSGGTQDNYGDLQQTGSQVSDIFGPSYWPQTKGLPVFAGDGNHGQNVDGLRTWPESATASGSGGTYAYDSYPALPADGTSAATYPDNWYAFSTGNTRIYVLDAAWADTGTGTASGSLCGANASACTGYQVDNDEHWTPGSPEYRWLAADLASHPGGVKMAVFHFPLRSDNPSQPSDPYLQNSTANPNASSSLEALMANNGVSIAFNAHAHTYQRIIPRQAGQITNYVTGGGGGVLEPVSGGGTCTGLLGSEDIFALGWSPTSGTGSSCGPGTTSPTSAADVYNFLKVTVTGSTVQVDPINAAGQSFDVHTYTPTTNSSTPSTPGNVTAEATSSSSIQVDWTASTVTGSTITAYNVYRNGTLVATQSGTSYTDPTASPGTQYTYTVTATDSAGRTSSAGSSNKVATPSAPGNVSATATSSTSVALSWTPSSEKGGTIGSYEIFRNSTLIDTVVGTSYADTSAQPATTYTYTIVALDGIGASSSPANSNPVTTPGPLTLPFSGPPPAPTRTDCMSHLPAGSVVGAASLANGSGYSEVDAQGDVAVFGAASCYGALTGTHLNKPIVGMAADRATGGYWLVASDGGIFSFNAPFHGSTGATRLNKPIVGMTAAADGSGYWFVASDGGVFAFNAPFRGSTGNIKLNKPIVGMALDPATGGYWLVATDGGVFSFHAPFLGSTGAEVLNKPIVGMAALSNGGGYRLIASDGGVFAFRAPFYGSTGAIRLNRPVIAGLDDPTTDGYWLIASDGGVFAYRAPFYGSAA